MNNNFCVAILKGHRNFVRSLASDATRIVTRDFGGFIKVKKVENPYMRRGEPLTFCYCGIRLM